MTRKIEYVKVEFHPDIHEVPVMQSTGTFGEAKEVGVAELRKMRTMIQIDGVEFNQSSLVTINHDDQTWVDVYTEHIRQALVEACKAHDVGNRKRHIYIDEFGNVTEE